MAGLLQVRQRAGTRTQGRWRFLAAAALLLPFLVGASPAALANREQQQDERRDDQSRHESLTLRTVPVVTADGRYLVSEIVLIQTGIVSVAATSAGVEFESLDRVDVSDVPLLGNLFGRPLRARDFTEQNRVGAVYSAGDGKLAVIIEDSVDLGSIRISVVNGKGQYKLAATPETATIAPGELGDFGTLRSVQTTMAGTEPTDTVLLLGGQRHLAEPAVESGVPVLDQLPLISRLFRGTAHQRDEQTLLILVKPSIIVQEEQD